MKREGQSDEATLRIAQSREPLYWRARDVGVRRKPGSHPIASRT
jgi:hypothetical protein